MKGLDLAWRAAQAAALARQSIKRCSSLAGGFDFDSLPDRAGTGAIKWDRYPPHVLPMWVADMDFRSCPAVTTALQDRVELGCFGYTDPTDGAIKSVIEYLHGSHGVTHVKEEDLFFMPGVVQGLYLACNLVPEGAGVMVFTPIYYPFLLAPEHTKRDLVMVPLTRDLISDADQEETWTFNWDAMGKAMSEKPHTKLVLLCNPHNPTGRAFTPGELRRMGQFCETHDLLLVSDEIHCDLILEPEVSHQPMVSLDKGRFAHRTITLGAPSKTYNIPGLGCGWALITNDSLRRRFRRAAKGIVTQNPALGYTAAEASYRHGEAWRLELIEYLRGNRDLLYSFIRERIPELSIFPMEATYLAWIDASRLGWEDPSQEFEKAGVGLSSGPIFGPPGRGYVRLNFACPRDRLLEALERMESRVDASRR
jgi:cystathionine beta-lyase